jgi:hypothetical protein
MYNHHSGDDESDPDHGGKIQVLSIEEPAEHGDKSDADSRPESISDTQGYSS